MNSLIKLTVGEVKRLIRYKILPVSLATSVLWVILFLFVSGAEARVSGIIKWRDFGR